MLRTLLIAAALTVVACALPAHAATPDQVDAAVTKGIANLYSAIATGNAEVAAAPSESPGDWNSLHNQAWGGQTAITVLSLLVAGEKPEDPRIARAIDWLEHANLRGTYPTAIRAQIWGYLDYNHTPAIKDCIKHEADTLLNGVTYNSNTQRDGMYQYYVTSTPMPGTAGPSFTVMPTYKDGGPEWYDHSNSQLAVLGVWALAETNVVEIPSAYWQLVEKGWMGSQYADGAWGYHIELASEKNVSATDDAGRTKHTMSMTASGVATLFITEDYLRADSSCSGNLDNANIRAGIKWMAANFSDTYFVRPAEKDFQALKYYGVYAVERVGQASGRKYLGDTINWFQEGADKILGGQGADGSWGNLPDTCLAMLFLCHGRAPIMLNKLEYNIDMHGDKTKEANWNQRPHDARHLARWMGKSAELEFNWQIVNLHVPVDELHDAPILYLAGDQDLDFTKEEEAKLKQFCEDGGLIMFNADCGSSKFSAAVRKLGTRLFPGSEFRELPQDHPIYTEEQFKRNLWHTKISVEGLTNGARELMILFPKDDPARLWHTGAYGGHEERHNVAADIFEYIAGNINKLRKGSTFIVRPTAGGGGKPIKVARLQYQGMWDPEPGGWRRLAAIMHNNNKGELSVETVNLGAGKLKDYSVAHLTGTYAIGFTDAQRNEIKDFINAGGTLIIDSCGGSAPFAASMQDEMAKIFATKGDVPMLRPDHAVFSGIDKFIYRRYAQHIVGKRLTAPRLRGLQINGRVAVYLSAEDLSVGLVGVPVDGIYGYDPDTACALMSNLLTTAAH